MENCKLVDELNRLRKSSRDSIDGIGDFGDFKKYMHISRNVEEELIEILHKIEVSGRKSLVLLCGSAGDGKSHLLSYLKNDLKLLDNYVVYNDATESSAPSKTAIETLSEALQGFSDKNLDQPGKNFILAINLGVLSNFVESTYGEAFKQLREYVINSNILTNQLDEKGYEKNSAFQHERFYDKNPELFFYVNKEELCEKRIYINGIRHNFYITERDKRSKEIEKLEIRIKKLEKVHEELKRYSDALEEGIIEYKKKIISDIEPLLHVYTAKILQQKFNGKSIYISTNEAVDNIQFVNSMKDKQDILYSMSSGQLSAVAISFLLCMNQVYGKNNPCSILLIDDPVQTIDDVNMVGLVDLLRYEFEDRQIFISTHEQTFEWFLRYRYSKANKAVKIFNMKEIMLNEEA